MRDAEQVRRFLRAEHRELLGTALLLTGDRSGAADLIGAATSRVLRRHGAVRLTGGAVRDEMARIAASGGVPARQVLDAGLPAGVDDDLAPLAAALDDLPPTVRTVAVLRIADDVPVDSVARVLTLPEAEVRAAEAEALARLGPAAGDADRLPGRLDALAAVPPDDGGADRVADAVLAGRRRRRGAAALVAAALLAVPVTLAATDRAATPPGSVEGSTEELVEAPARTVEVLAGAVRGSLAADVAFLGAARRVPWGTDEDPPVEERRVVYADDTVAGRVALVVADTPTGLDGAWLLGPRGALAGELTAFVPERIGRTRPAAVLVDGADGTAAVVVAAPGDAVEFSPRLRSEPSGALSRDWSGVPVEDGTAVVEVAGPAEGRAAAVRVVRDEQVVARPLLADPSSTGAGVPPLDLEPLRPGTTEPDPVLVAEAVARVARPFGADLRVFSPRLLWSAELSRSGGAGRVVVLVARVPGNAHVVTAVGRLGTVRGGLAIPCGTTSFPAELPPSTMSVATVCSVSDGSDAGADRTWLVVTAPAAVTTAEVLDEDGGVLDVLPVERGGGMARTPDGAAAVRVLDDDGRTFDVIPVTPSSEAPFGDYGDG